MTLSRLNRTKTSSKIICAIAILLCTLLICRTFDDVEISIQLLDISKKSLTKTEITKTNVNTTKAKVTLFNDEPNFKKFLKNNKIKCPEAAVNKSEFLAIPQILATACSSPYVTIDDRGRLGNQICQYMSLWLFRKQFGARVLIPDKTFEMLSKYFSNPLIPHGNSECFPSNSSSVASSSYKEIYQNFYNSIDYLKKNKMADSPLIKSRNFITGYPCESDKIVFYREELRKELQIKPAIICQAKSRMSSFLEKSKYRRDNITLVSVHVRRTDFIKYALYRKQILPDDMYFKAAMDSFRRRYDNVVFAVFSDDIAWCMEHLIGGDVIYPGSGDIADPIFDFTLIKLCDHHIIGLGTYSFTSAFLGGGDITYIASSKYKSKTFICNPFLKPILVS